MHRDIVISQWFDFKSVVRKRKIVAQWVELSNEYQIFAQDGSLCFLYTVDKSNLSEKLDFEQEYKASWDINLGTKFGKRATVHASPRPEESTTYFSGAGDNGGPGLGARLIFDMKSTDESKYVDLYYEEAVAIKDAIIKVVDAPLGSYITMEIIHPDPTIGALDSNVRVLNLLGEGRMDLNADDSAVIPVGLKLRVAVYNSDDQLADQVAPADFQVVGNIEMYRETTV